MHTIKDYRHGIYINHNGDWSGIVHVSWRSRVPASEAERKHDAACPVIEMSPNAGGPPGLMSSRGMWSHMRTVDGYSLIAGYWSPRDPHPLDDPPLNVITRAIALAVERYLTTRLTHAVEDLAIPREGR